MPKSSVLNEPDKALFRAISNDNLEGVQEALQVGANPNAIEGHHHTALSRAVVSDNSKIARTPAGARSGRERPHGSG